MNHKKIISNNTDTSIYKSSNNMCYKVETMSNIIIELANNKILPQLDIFYNLSLVTIENCTKEEREFFISNSKSFTDYFKSQKKNIDKLSAKNLLTDEEHELFLNSLTNFKEPLLKLFMPFIDGKTFLVYFEEYKDKIISIKKWIMLIKNLLFLLKNILILNNNNIYHNDIHSENIIISNNKIYLIDFDQLFYNNDKKLIEEDTSTDIIGVKELIFNTIKIGFKNDNISLLLEDFNILNFVDLDIIFDPYFDKDNYLLTIISDDKIRVLYKIISNN